MCTDKELLWVHRSAALKPDALRARRRTAAQNGHQKREKREESSRREDEMTHMGGCYATYVPWDLTTTDQRLATND